MRLRERLGELTYCLNIHPAHSWGDVKNVLLGPVRAVKDNVCPDASFCIGLRLSGAAISQLRSSDARQELAHILTDNDYRAITLNGFPYGPFHGRSVKEDVYQPDWRLQARVAYTKELAALMAALAKPGETVSISTVPGTFKPLGRGAEGQMAANLIETVAECVLLRATTGVTVALAIEPEPCCFLETIAETVAYFEDYLFSDGAIATLARRTGLSLGEAADSLPRHLGVCYDVCHAAIEFEDPANSFEKLRKAGVLVHKLQLSAALRIEKVTPASRSRLRDFDEPTYLHQVVMRSATGLTRATDLSLALSRGSQADGEEWRIHFHVPIFMTAIDGLGTTQSFLREVLRLHRQAPLSNHLEVETYTWDVLPEAARTSSVSDAIARELQWVIAQLQ